MQIPFNTRLEDVLDWLPAGYLASPDEVVMPVHLVLHRFVARFSASFRFPSDPPLFTQRYRSHPPPLLPRDRLDLARSAPHRHHGPLAARRQDGQGQVGEAGRVDA